MENKIEKRNEMWLMLVWTYIAAAVYVLLYGDFLLKEVITSAIGAALMINYLVRKRKYKDELRPDEMARKISEMSSNIAFISTLMAVALLAIALETFPGLIDAKGILAVLAAVIIVSKITGQLYYSRMKKEIGF